ncbi:asparagine synthase-related protein [Steroidobacter cummioxidans]|uniref:asparagine synthase-related protein n=1 Tax=Steroidobacter cummioxidans TaxID=1803913 RepID=UPI000E316932|nr:asparagine synthase-related protein [Steroidobacter cummioxidans]
MVRFLAIVANHLYQQSMQWASSLHQRMKDAAAWEALTDHGGLTVYVHRTCDSSRQSIALYQNAGVILGTLFKRSTDVSDSERRWMIEARQTMDILRTNGRSLLQTDWGSYLLFLRCPEEHTIRVLRGPAGTLPCYYLTYHRCVVLVSHTADLLWLCPDSLSINWDSIRAQAAAGDYLTHETGLREVAAVLSGECLAIHDGKVTHHSYWNPCTLCTDPVPDLADAAALLRRETRRCVSAWASLHESVLLLLSGGLDSSIVLSCLRTASTRTRVIAVNFYSEGAGDERRFARSMAERTSTELQEIPSQLSIDLRDFLHCSLTPSPVLNFTAFDVEPTMQRMARRHNATAILTGETGDDVFGHAPAPEALSELLQHSAQMLRFFSAAMDYAELTRISVWRAMQLAYRSLKWSRRIGVWSVYRHRNLVGQSHEDSLASQEALRAYEAMIPRYTHPWFKAAERMPLGKAMLIYSIIKITSSMTHSPFCETDGVPMMTPLASQPLLEAALRIPSHTHFSGAENGAVARAAFRADLSPQVLNRGTGKGTPAAWARSLLDHNATVLGDLLLEGLLVQQGVLDRSKIQSLLSKEVSRTRVGMAELIRQIYMEIWLRRWARAGARL